MTNTIKVLAAATAACLMSCAFSVTIDLSTVTGNRTLNDYDIITGTLSAKVKLSIADGARVYLRNATIPGYSGPGYESAGLTCIGDAEICIDGENHVKGFNADYPGIYVPVGKTLTISQAENTPAYNIALGNQMALGGGTLTAPGHNMASGIGAGYNLSCGNIVIESGIIDAAGKNSAGIGGGCNSSCGNITIKGGVVQATGASGCAGIGGSQNMSCGAITIEDGVAFVVAQAGSNCENPIGAGSGGTCGAVTVTLAEDATDTTEVKSLGYHVRTIERPSIVQQYANGLTWDFRIANGEAEICKMRYLMGMATYAGALVIPDSLGGCPVTTIGDSALNASIEITSATIPDGVKNIKGWAFQLCSKLKSVTIPASVTNIGVSAFRNCAKLTGVTIPESVTELGAGAFENCDALTSVTIPGSVKRIGELAFEGCDGFTSGIRGMHVFGGRERPLGRHGRRRGRLPRLPQIG